MRYCDTLSLAISNNSMTVYIFSANGIYDPNVTGTGHQPYGFDQISPFYNHWVVERSEMLIVPASAGAPDHLLAIKLSDAAAIAATRIDWVVEQNNVVFANSESMFFAGQQLKIGFDTRKFWKLSSDPALKDELCGDAASNPTDQAYYCICVGAIPYASSDIDNCSMAVVIEYDVKFFEPNELAIS